MFKKLYEPRQRVAVACGTGMTKQSNKKECDINYILKKYEKTGLIEHQARSQPRYGDFDHVTYQESLNLVIQAEESFAALPSRVRQKFSNNPMSFLEFCSNPENRQEMIDLGLMKDDLVEGGTPDMPPISGVSDGDKSPANS